MEGSAAAAPAGAAARVRALTDDVIRKVRAQSRQRLMLMVIPPLVVLALIVTWFIASAGHVGTDNATVGAARAPISASVRGRVVEVLVHENQLVHRGDVLFRLDPDTPRSNVAEAEANLAAAKLRVDALRAGYNQSVANRRASEANSGNAANEARRQQRLFADGIISRQDLERSQTEALVAQRETSAAVQAEATALANLGGRTDIATDQHPTVLQAQAALQRARDELDNTDIVAPIDGVVTRTAQLQVGEYVQPAQTVFYLVSGRPWIDAAFKENQIGHLRPGQAVTIHIDAFPGQTFHGHVESLSPGTGSSFAVLPAENASGNWVRVVQRLNVRIVFDDAAPDTALAMGLSARVDVNTNRNVGPPFRGRV